MKYRLSIMLVLLAGLAGCSTAGIKNVKPGYSLAKAQANGNGLVVGSVTTDNPDTGLIPSLELYYGETPAVTDGNTLLTSGLQGCHGSNSGKSDFQDACGTLFAVELPAGDYYVHPWQMTLFPPLRVCTPITWTATRITVVAGKATYIGSFHAILKIGGQDRFGEGKVTSAWAAAGDERARDIGLLTQRYPSITADDISYSPASFAPADDTNDPANGNCGGH